MLGEPNFLSLIFLLVIYVGIPAGVVLTIVYFIRGGFGTCPKCKSGVKKGASVCARCGSPLMPK